MKIGILFDLDGTLLDTLDDLYAATNHTLRHFGCPERTKDEVRRFVGNGARNQIRMALPEQGDHPPLEQVLAYYQSYYNQVCKDGTAAPYPGIPEAVAELQQRYPIAVVSNKPDSAVRQLCQVYFPGVYARGVSDDCPRKPQPDMVFKAMQAIGADRCIYVGDSEVDVLTAQNAQVPCLSVLWGFRDLQTLQQAGATHFCQDPQDLPAAIKKMIKEM